MRVRVYIFGIDEGEQEIDDESIVGKFLQGQWVDGFEAINAMAVDVNAVAANADNCAPPSKRRRDGIVNSIRNDERIQADAEACYDEQHGIRSNDDIAAIARCLRRMRDEYEQRIRRRQRSLQRRQRGNDVTLVRQYRVRCDSCGQAAEVDWHNTPLRARNAARRGGWTSRRYAPDGEPPSNYPRRDYCPVCTEATDTREEGDHADAD